MFACYHYQACPSDEWVCHDRGVSHLIMTRISHTGRMLTMLFSVTSSQPFPGSGVFLCALLPSSEWGGVCRRQRATGIFIGLIAHIDTDRWIVSPTNGRWVFVSLSLITSLCMSHMANTIYQSKRSDLHFVAHVRSLIPGTARCSTSSPPSAHKTSIHLPRLMDLIDLQFEPGLMMCCVRSLGFVKTGGSQINERQSGDGGKLRC